MRLMNALVLAPLALGAAGCFRVSEAPALTDEPTPSVASSPSATLGELRVSSAEQSGSMGDVRGFAGGADQLHVEQRGEWSYVRVDSLGEGWWVMSALNLRGDLAGAAFAPGTRRVYTNGVPTDGSDTSLSLLGCSGPSLGNYTYDSTAPEVEVEVEDAGEGGRVLRFRAVHEDGTRSEGRLVYTLAPAGI